MNPRIGAKTVLQQILPGELCLLHEALGDEERWVLYQRLLGTARHQPDKNVPVARIRVWQGLPDALPRYDTGPIAVLHRSEAPVTLPVFSVQPENSDAS